MSDLDMGPEATMLLSGIVGSQAYGMATPESDEDRLCVVLLPTTALIGLAMRKETWTSTTPDVTFHEIGKFMNLALKANPTILDLLWLDRYDVLHPTVKRFSPSGQRRCRKSLPTLRRHSTASRGRLQYCPICPT